MHKFQKVKPQHHPAIELARKIPTLDLWSKNQRERENIEVDPSERANSEDEAIPANAIKRVITLMHHAKCVP